MPGLYVAMLKKVFYKINEKLNDKVNSTSNSIHRNETTTIRYGLKTTPLHRVIFPIPYGDASTDFNVFCIQQPMLNTDDDNVLLAQNWFL